MTDWLPPSKLSGSTPGFVSKLLYTSQETSTSLKFGEFLLNILTDEMLNTVKKGTYYKLVGRKLFMLNDKIRQTF